MYFTLAQVRKALAGTTDAYKSADLDWDINRAIEGLAGLSGWECLRRTVRFFSAGPVFALPQGYAGLVRVCVNGRPASLRGQDFRFLQSGPGDLRRPPSGFVSVATKNVVDIGMSPVIMEPVHRFKLVTFTDAPRSDTSRPEWDTSGGKVLPKLTVVGLRPDGRMAREELSLNGYDSDGSWHTDDGEFTPGSVEFSRIEDVVVPENASDYITLYAVPADSVDYEADGYQISCYNPRLSVPRFRRYELTSVPPGMPIEVIAETRIEPVPLVRDTDVVPFQSPIEPIGWMIRADWAMKSGEVTQAQNYRTQAMNWLKAQEITDDTIQTQVVVNSVYSGSMGEISEEADNI